MSSRAMRSYLFVPNLSRKTLRCTRADSSASVPSMRGSDERRSAAISLPRFKPQFVKTFLYPHKEQKAKKVGDVKRDEFSQPRTFPSPTEKRFHNKVQNCGKSPGMVMARRCCTFSACLFLSLWATFAWAGPKCNSTREYGARRGCISRITDANSSSACQQQCCEWAANSTPPVSRRYLYFQTYLFFELP